MHAGVIKTEPLLLLRNAVLVPVLRWITKGADAIYFGKKIFGGSDVRVIHFLGEVSLLL